MKTVGLIGLIVLFLLCAALMFYPDYQEPRVVKFLVLSQILFALSIAILSDDIYRYMWEGKVVVNGINPFAYSPSDPELTALRDTVIYPQINHPWLPTIYPPLAQSMFAAAYTIGGDTTWAFKLLCAVFELLTLAALLVWLPMVGARRSVLLLYLFSPLILIEFYLSAHLDILAMPFLIAALIAVQRARPGIAGIMLALASLIKFFGLFFVPFIFFYFRRGARWKFGGIFVSVVALSYLPFIAMGGGEVFGSLTDYLSEWQFNASVFELFKAVIGFTWARNLMGGLFAGWLVLLLFRRMNIFKRLYRAFAGYVILTTTLFPWYLVWLFPFMLVYRSPAFLFLSGAILLSYHVHIGFYATGEWSVIPWLTALAYAPFYGLLIRQVVRRKNRG